MCASLSKNAGRLRSLLPATIFATTSSVMPAAFPASSTTRWTLCRMEIRVWQNGTDPCSNLSDMKMSGCTAILKSALRIKTRARKSTCRYCQIFLFGLKGSGVESRDKQILIILIEKLKIFTLNFSKSLFRIKVLYLSKFGEPKLADCVPTCSGRSRRSVEEDDLFRVSVSHPIKFVDFEVEVDNMIDSSADRGNPYNPRACGKMIF